MVRSVLTNLDVREIGGGAFFFAWLIRSSIMCKCSSYCQLIFVEVTGHNSGHVMTLLPRFRRGTWVFAGAVCDFSSPRSRGFPAQRSSARR